MVRQRHEAAQGGDLVAIGSHMPKARVQLPRLPTTTTNFTVQTPVKHTFRLQIVMN